MCNGVVWTPAEGRKEGRKVKEGKVRKEGSNGACLRRSNKEGRKEGRKK
jgi:hypothetical protein